MATGCGGALAPLVPEELPPLEAAVVARWVTDLVPARAQKYDLKWAYETQQGKSRGRAVARFAPPDSLRLDFRAPFGRSGAAVAVGDSVLWSKPEEGIRRLMPVVPLFWAVLGIPRIPPEQASFLGLEREDSRVIRYVADGDTLTYVFRRGPSPKLQLEARRGGRALGRVDVDMGTSGWAPGAAVMRFPQEAAIVLFTVESVEELDAVDPETWKEP